MVWKTIKNRFVEIEHKKMFVDSMVGMTVGFLATLVVGTVVGMLGIGQDNKWHSLVENIKNILTYLTPFGIGIGVGYKLGLTNFQLLSVGLGTHILAHSSFIPTYNDGGLHEFNWNGDIGIGVKLTNPGDVFAAWLGAISIVYMLKVVVVFESPISVILVPLLGVMFGIVDSLYLTYITSTILVITKYVIDKSVNENYMWAIALSPIIGILMGLALSFPTSSVAIAVALHLQGNAATAAIAGTAAQMISFGVLTYISNKKISKGIAVGFGSSMIQMRNFMRNPSILIIPCIASGVAALVAVSFVNLSFAYSGDQPSITSGMGTCALYGQIYSLQDNGWDSIRAWMNVIFIQLTLPALLSIVLYKLFKKLNWLNLENLKI